MATATKSKAKSKSKTKLQPLGDRLIIQPLERDDVTSSGIILPDTAQEKPQEGIILAAGPGRITDDGKRQAMEVTSGDTVLFAKYAGTEVKIDDEELLILRESDVLAKIN